VREATVPVDPATRLRSRSEPGPASIVSVLLAPFPGHHIALSLTNGGRNSAIGNALLYDPIAARKP
jgi:hypothetical protein